MINRRAGHNDTRAARAAIEEALRLAGRPYEVTIVAGGDAATRAARSAVRRAAGAPATVIAAGGDGTVNAVAQILAGTNVALGVVPLGTFNYLARNLGIPLEPGAATRAILSGRIERVSMGCVNGRTFLNNASIGLYQRLLEERERRKRRFGRNKLVSLLSGLASLVRYHRHLRVRLTANEQAREWRTLMLFFGNNALQLEHLDLPEADCVRQRELALLALPPLRRWELLRLALRGALWGLHGEPRLVTTCARRFEVDIPRRPDVRVALDGEMTRCTLPLEIESMSDALGVVVPERREPCA